MLSNGTHREFRRTAVEEANDLLKSRMHLPFSMVGGVRNTGQLSKRYCALYQPSQSRTSHPRRLCCFTEGRSIVHCFHSSHIPEKMFPLLFIEERIIKGRAHIGRLPSLFFCKVNCLGERFCLHVAA